MRWMGQLFSGGRSRRLRPYLAIYLLTGKLGRGQHRPRDVIATFAGIVAQTPAGALIDATGKAAVMIAAATLVTAASLVLPWLPSFWPVAASQASARREWCLRPRSQRSRSASSGTRHSRAPAATKPSTMPETRARPGWPASPPSLWAVVVFYLIAAMSLASIGALAIPAARSTTTWRAA